MAHYQLCRAVPYDSLIGNLATVIHKSLFFMCQMVNLAQSCIFGKNRMDIDEVMGKKHQAFLYRGYPC